MIGSEGTIVLNFNDSTIEVSRPSLGRPELKKVSLSDSSDMYFEQMVDFLRAIETGGRPAQSST